MNVPIRTHLVPIALTVTAVLWAAGCVPGNTRGAEAPLYANGDMCSAADIGHYVPCPPDHNPAAGVCVVQACDHLTGIASACERIPGCSYPTPMPGTNPDGSTSCTPGTPYACRIDGRPGVTYCLGDGTSYSPCSPIGEPLPEAGVPPVTCGGAMLPATCTVGTGACARPGTPECVGDVASCTGTPGPSMTEICNGLDDDCNGLVDDNPDGSPLTVSCFESSDGSVVGDRSQAGVGECQWGVATCTAGALGACTGAVLPATEIPDNLDDEDCNGEALQSAPCGGHPAVGTACSVGRGACYDDGTWTCSGSSIICDAVAGMPTAEACNGIDDDCNGVVDTHWRSFYTGPAGTVGLGICHLGYDQCIAAVWERRIDERTPDTEICESGADEDCNGLDDACSGPCGDDSTVGTRTTCGTGICARPGTIACVSGSPQCVPDSPLGTAQSEACNGLDDDCDGTVDEVPPRACADGFDLALAMNPPCMAGTQTCVAGSWGACVGSVGPTAATETSAMCGNGVDEDCSGTDLSCVACGGDSTVGTRTTCGTGACARPGTITCDATGTHCTPDSPLGMPTAETCNNIDDDCDGTVDDGVVDTACNDEAPPGAWLPNTGRCRYGSRTCTAGVFGACTGDVGPIAEICGNGVDDDCDTVVDDGCSSSADAGTPPSDAGTSADSGPPSLASSMRDFCRSRRVGDGYTGTHSVTYDATCINSTFGSCPGGWSVMIADWRGCDSPSDPGVMTLTIDVDNANVGQFTRTGLTCLSSGVTRAWPALDCSPGAPLCITDFRNNGISRLDAGTVQTVLGDPNLRPTFPSGITGPVPVACP